MFKLILINTLKSNYAKNKLSITFKFLKIMDIYFLIYYSKIKNQFYGRSIMGIKKEIKLRLIGGPGCGKTYISQKLKKYLNITPLDLDKIFWKISKSGYLEKNDRILRNKNLDLILNNNSWIIEGVYISPWTINTFEKSDYILILQVNKLTQIFRIIKRFILRKITKYRPKENFSDLKNLISWSFKYDQDLKEFINKNNYSKKIVFIYDEKDLNNFFNKIEEYKYI